MLQRGPGWAAIESTPAARLIREQVAQLSQRIRRGDPSAEAELAEQFYPRVLVMLTARTRDRDAARDLAQVVMMDTLAAVRGGHVDDPGNLVAFIHGVARNVASDHFRERRRQLRNVPLDPELRAPATPDHLDSRHIGRLVRHAVRQLDQVDQTILHMVFVREMSAVDIGSTLGMSAENVRQRKSRALAKLRAACHETPPPRDMVPEALDG